MIYYLRERKKKKKTFISSHPSVQNDFFLNTFPSLFTSFSSSHKHLLMPTSKRPTLSPKQSNICENIYYITKLNIFILEGGWKLLAFALFVEPIFNFELFRVGKVCSEPSVCWKILFSKYAPKQDSAYLMQVPLRRRNK